MVRSVPRRWHPWPIHDGVRGLIRSETRWVHGYRERVLVEAWALQSLPNLGFWLSPMKPLEQKPYSCA